MTRSIFATIACVTVALSLFGCSSGTQSTPPAKPAGATPPEEEEVSREFIDQALKQFEITEDQVPPEITGTNGKGKAMKLSDHKGKVVMLDFWHSTCPPCLGMMPHEKVMVQRLKDKPFVLLGVNNDPARETLASTEQQRGLTWESWWDGDRKILHSYQARWRDLTGWPSVFLIDHKGQVRYFIPGAFPGMRQVLDHVVDKLIDEIPK